MSTITVNSEKYGQTSYLSKTVNLRHTEVSEANTIV
jgi:hypothetical protein